MAVAPVASDLGEQGLSARQVRRLETRARLFDAAVTEMGRRGLAGADVTAIANSVGVVRGTFYFHFPTKEHVLVELQHREETAVVAEITATDTADGDLLAKLTVLVRRILETRKRIGTTVFRDMLSMQFASSRPVEDGFAEHPVQQYIVNVITEAQRKKRVSAEADAAELALFFGTGLYALLAAGVHDMSTLSRYVTTIVNGMEKR